MNRSPVTTFSLHTLPDSNPLPLKNASLKGSSKRIAAAGSLLAVAALLFAPASAMAATATATMAVTTNVVATCTVTITALTLPDYTSTAASAANATVTPICSDTTPYTIGLDAGTSGGTVTTRAMFVTGTPGVLLNYGLFSNAGLTVNFATTATITGNGAAQPVTIYGNIPAGQTVAPGAYQDTITATITY